MDSTNEVTQLTQREIDSAVEVHGYDLFPGPDHLMARLVGKSPDWSEDRTAMVSIPVEILDEMADDLREMRRRIVEGT